MLKLSPLLRELTIQTKKLETVKFPIDDTAGTYSEFGWAQRRFTAEIENQYNSGKPVRIIVLKARQLGISTATEGVLFNWAFLHPGMNGLVVAHEAGPSENLFQKTKLFWETWPLKEFYSLKYATRHQFQWQETRSNLQVATAKNIQSGRGSTLHAVHLSEFAFYDNPETLMTGLNQTIPDEHGTIVIIESTANGVGNLFHEMWDDAEAGISEYTPLFFPWFHHYEYQHVTSLCSKLELSPYERWLLKQGCTYNNIQWRRWAIVNRTNNDEQEFMQEYPTTPEEAFISTGQPIFPHQRVLDCFDEEPGYRGMLVEDGKGRLDFIREPAGNLIIFRAPSKTSSRNDRYFVSGDPSMTVEGDPACIQVVNRKTLEQVAVWHGRCDPITFAGEMMKVGKYYHNAMLCPEVEGGGQATIATILAKNYPSVWQHRWADKAPGKVSVSFGWATNWQRKSWCIGELKSLIVDRSIKLHDRLTYQQLRNYVVRSDGTWGNADKNVHDDSVMALAINVLASKLEGPFVEDRSNSNPVFDIFSQEFPEWVTT